MVQYRFIIVGQRGKKQKKRSLTVVSRQNFKNFQNMNRTIESLETSGLEYCAVFKRSRENLYTKTSSIT